ncbi:MAG: Tn3 family transposase [Candidatus Micrarchaeaceae archaeon]
MASKNVNLLTAEQRAQLVQIPPDISDRLLARYHTLSDQELETISQHRRDHNRLGFAIQLCLLRFPGRSLLDLPEIPSRIISHVAAQIGVAASVFDDYGNREITVYEHLREIRQLYDFRNYGWKEILLLTRRLLLIAMQNHRPLPLVMKALDLMREEQIIAPGITETERLISLVLALADARVESRLTSNLDDVQRARLDGLLLPEASMKGKTPFSWLAQPAQTPSTNSLKKLVQRVKLIKDINLPTIDGRLHRDRVIDLSRRCSKYKSQALLKLPEKRRHALLVSHLSEVSQDLIDQTLDMFDRLMTELMTRGKNRQKEHFKVNARKFNTHLRILASAAKALLQAKSEGLDPYITVFETVDETTLAATVTKAEDIVRPDDLDYIDLIEGKYKYMRLALLEMFDTLNFQSALKKQPAIDALNHVSALAQANKRVTALQQKVAGAIVNAPLAHVTPTWMPHVVSENKVNPNFFEACAYQKLRGAMRSGDSHVPGSRRYRDFESYLIPKEPWDNLVNSDAVGLAITSDAVTYLQSRKEKMTELMKSLSFNLKDLDDISIDPDGTWHLSPLDSEVPAEVKNIQRRIYSLFPRVSIPDLLVQVNVTVGFLRHFTHIGTGEPVSGDRQLVLLAAIIASGLNHGLTKMADSCPFTYKQLAGARDLYIREETLARAQADIDNFVLHSPISKSWGDGTKSSSDGMRIKVSVQAAHADRNARYFGTGRGVTIYNHVADIGLPFAHKVISTNDREALHVIDALENHETDLNIKEHYTDTAGFTDHVFALCALLGYKFAPRIRDLFKLKLFSIGPIDDFGNVNSLIKDRINTQLIEDNWNEILRAAASIRHGTTSASLLMRKLAAYPNQNQLAKALAEIGKIERTIFLLQWLQDPPMRRRTMIGLNKGEHVNAVQKVLFFGRRGEVWDRKFEDQCNRASCLGLLVSAVGAWNSVYLPGAIEEYYRRGHELAPEIRQHIGPLGHEHINLVGHYPFESAEQYSLDQLLPLRSIAEIEIADEDDVEAYVALSGLF